MLTKGLGLGPGIAEVLLFTILWFFVGYQIGRLVELRRSNKTARDITKALERLGVLPVQPGVEDPKEK
jgi:hypothetical protein